MTARLPPLIKPDRRFSRIRLSEFHLSVAIFKLLVSAVRRVRGFGRVCNRATGDISPTRSRAFATTTAGADWR
jgi:hypothetical protein